MVKETVQGLLKGIITPPSKGTEKGAEKETPQKLEYDKLIPAFRFEVAFVNDGEETQKEGKEPVKVPEPVSIPFSEVSGLNLELQTEDIMEGGGNGYTIRLPKPPKARNLVLKRAMSATAPEIILWARKAVENFDISTRTVIVTIKDYQGNNVKVWNFEKAYPVKLSLSDFSATKNEVVIETLELAYRRFHLM